MKYVVIDLEMNDVPRKSEYRSICTKETIEIGAVMIDESLKEVDSFLTYVKPSYSETIAPKISRLTGITDEDVADAPLFNDALKTFMNWCTGGGDEVIIYAWSDSDFLQISKEIDVKSYEISEKERELLTNPWKDFQGEFDVQMGFERQLSLKTALDLAGIDFEGHEHDALDDARNTAELLHVFKDPELFEKTLKKVQEVMTPSESGYCLGEMFDFSQFLSD